MLAIVGRNHGVVVVEPAIALLALDSGPVHEVTGRAVRGADAGAAQERTQRAGDVVQVVPGIARTAVRRARAGDARVRTDWTVVASSRVVAQVASGDTRSAILVRIARRTVHHALRERKSG